MVKPLLFALFGVLVISAIVSSRSSAEPLHFTVADSQETGLTLGGEPLHELMPLSSSVQRQADQSVSKIRMSQIRAMRSQGQQAVLVFDDGSELAVTPFVMESLSPEIRIRLSYER